MPLVELPQWTEGCPPSLTLAAYLLGKLPAATVEKVATHLVHCPRCEALLLESSEEEDSLVLKLRRCAAGQPAAGTAALAASYSAATVVEADVLSTPAPAGLPARLGHYVLLEQLGQGGMGVVYKALQDHPNRLVAVKLALGGPLPGTAAFARFQVEIEAIGRLQHDNIVRVLDCGEHEGRPYFSMDYVEGSNLAQKLAGKPLAARQAASLVQTVARAVQFAHDRQIIHRDLKPANVLIGTDGTVKLTDFGLAKFLDADQAQTLPYAVVGTASYIAPEQARGDATKIGRPADVYGLGAILYEALTGRPPFKGKNRDETLLLVRTEEPVPPSRLVPRIPRDLETVCLRCLAKDAKDRYPSAAALAEDLGRWLRGEPTEARPRLLPARAWLWLRRCAVAVAAATVVTLAVLYKTRDPEDVSQPIESEAERIVRGFARNERELAQGRPVTVVGKTGMPEVYRWRGGETKTALSQAGDGSLAVATWAEVCLLELANVPRDSYQISAQVRQLQAKPFNDLGGCGLFFARQPLPGVQADLQLFMCMHVSDNEHQGGAPSYLDVDARMFWDGNDFPRYNSSLAWSSRTFLEGPSHAWHTLKVTVTPRSIQPSLDGAPIKEFFAEACAKDAAKGWRSRRKLWTRNFQSLLPERPPAMTTRGGLGLYLTYGSATFREVVVTPLDGAP
jgi:serine/threonine-protein kinase